MNAAKDTVIIHKTLVGSDLAKALCQKYKIRGKFQRHFRQGRC